MSTNRLRVLLVSVLAVFALSAVASASASAACRQVVEAGTGNWENNICTVTGTSKEYIKVLNLNSGTQLKNGEWCLKVEEKETGNYETNKCEAATKKAKSEYIKVKVSGPFWEVCKKGGSQEFSEHKCLETEEGGEWSWLKLETGESYNVVSKGGEQKLVLDTAGEKPTVTCKHVADKGNIKGGEPGTDEVTELKYTECTTNFSCPVVKTEGQSNGTIVVPPGLKTELFEEGGVIKDRVSPASGTTFVVLEFGKKENASTKAAEGICSPLTAIKNKVEGTAVAKVEGENLNFTGEGTLTVDGIPSELKGVDEQELENKWAFRAKL